MIDYSKYPTTPAVPEASSMIETFRAIGYTIEAAVADIIDNSISAGARNVWVDFEWMGEATWLSIRDDGCGMNNDELVQAMRPGSKNPLEDRSSKDLGRFGLGLKTASFSQCRRLSVVSRRENCASVFWTWDLDFVNLSGKWNLIQYLPQGNFLRLIDASNSGTIVIWNAIDRLVKGLDRDDEKALDKFLVIIAHVKKHLAMVFHKFIENGRLKIYFQGRVIGAWNPFMPDEAATQGFPVEFFCDGEASVKGYVLPHKSKLSEEKFKHGEGPKGWNEQQGFYIYRNERMLLAGDWLGMFRKGEPYRLARIEINLPNHFDADWQIDIKKSVARPPLFVRDPLRAYASKVRAQAVEVYRHRGKSAKLYPGQKFVPLWVDHKRGDKWFYKVNREHPFLEVIRRQAFDKPEKAIESLLRIIEETIPAKSIFIREAEDPETQGKPFEGFKSDDLTSLMKSIFESLRAQGKQKDEAKAVILNLEPFNLYPEVIANLE